MAPYEVRYYRDLHEVASRLKQSIGRNTACYNFGVKFRGCESEWLLRERERGWERETMGCTCAAQGCIFCFPFCVVPTLHFVIPALFTSPSLVQMPFQLPGRSAGSGSICVFCSGGILLYFSFHEKKKRGVIILIHLNMTNN